MRSTTSNGSALRVAALFVGVVAVFALLVGSALGRGDPDPGPTQPPSASPTSPGPTTPPGSPSGSPTETPGTGKVLLDNATGHDITVVIDDRTDALVRATSGKPGDGMSVRWFDSIIESVDARTISITWAGLPLDDEVELSIVEDGGTYRIDIVQLGPPAQSDAVGFDRILILELSAPVDPADVEVTIANSNDPS